MHYNRDRAYLPAGLQFDVGSRVVDELEESKNGVIALGDICVQKYYLSKTYCTISGHTTRYKNVQNTE